MESEDHGDRFDSQAIKEDISRFYEKLKYAEERKRT